MHGIKVFWGSSQLRMNRPAQLPHLPYLYMSTVWPLVASVDRDDSLPVRIMEPGSVCSPSTGNRQATGLCWLVIAKVIPYIRLVFKASWARTKG